MRKCRVLSCVLLLLLPASAMARGSADVFGGYSFLRENIRSGANLDGWNASLTGRITDRIGVVGDFAGNRATPGQPAFGPVGNMDTSIYTFLFGPRLYGPNYGSVSPFVHALFGAARGSAESGGFSVSDAAFAMALGGGVDLRVTRAIGIRLFQADYLMTRFFDVKQNNARISAGVVFRFRVD
jgi:opacity protein-like surface antigen